MKVLVLGASGATGRHVAKMLLGEGHDVTIIVRSTDGLPDSLKNNDKLTTVRASLLELSDQEMTKHFYGCDAVASCLGHNMNFKGMYGNPRKLVTEATQRVCANLKNDPSSTKRIKFVLMNTSGNRNRDLDEKVSLGEKMVIGMVRALVPPHRDNEQAADFLRCKIGQTDQTIEWTAVRPDGLINEEAVSKYEAFPSPTRSAIFDAGKISRINVAHFMTSLITDDDVWQKWKGQMPVLYSTASDESGFSAG